MRTLVVGIVTLALLAGCSSPHKLTYSSGFSFANYDSIVIERPDAADGAVFGLDIEFANLFSRYGMKVLGQKEYEALPAEAKARTLVAHLEHITGKERGLFSILFDDASTGKTLASVSGEAEGNMLDRDDRTEAFETISEALAEAIEKDRGLSDEG